MGEGLQKGRNRGQAVKFKSWYLSRCKHRTQADLPPMKHSQLGIQIPDLWKSSQLTWLCATHWIRPVDLYRRCSLLPGAQVSATNQRCGLVHDWRSRVVLVAGWRQIRLPAHLLPTGTTSSLAVASCCHQTVSDLHYLPNTQRTKCKDRRKVTKIDIR